MIVSRLKGGGMVVLRSEVDMVAMWDKEGGGKGDDTLISSSEGGVGLEKGWISMLETCSDKGIEPRGFLALNWEIRFWI